ncbi:MAG: hypothetical protein JWM80_1728 [Cyanobacteria bacterium RYN_339]|nr:hypothetical protein [Cyanobacteria bacterium RYN_339]
MPSLAMRLGMAWGRLNQRPWVTPLLLFFLFWALYAYTGAMVRNSYTAHVYLANAMLHGHLDIPDPPGHFELVWFQNKAYLPYGMGPSLLMLPFVAIFGLSFHQGLFACGLGALTVAIWWRIIQHWDLDREGRFWLFLVWAIGCPFWFYAGKNGATWPLMHMVTLFGLSLSMLDVYGKRRGWVAGLGLGIAMLARQNVILSLPFFAYMLIRPDADPATPAAAQPPADATRREVGFIGTIAGFLAFNAAYNWARFGTPTDNGYARFILGKDNPPFGIFSTQYLWKNFSGYFLSLPSWETLTIMGRIVPWPNPTYDGVNLFISYPVILVALFANWRQRANQLALLTVVMIMTVYMFYYWSGWTQFGKRYFLDALPFMMVLAASGARKVGSDALRRACLLGALVELWGICWWTMKGW